MNLTLVAFYNSKPDPLRWLVESLQSALDSELGPAFSAYAMEQVHATIIGLEGWQVGEETYNANASRVSGLNSAMDLPGLLQFMQEMPPFRIRIGGFLAGGNYPFTSRGLHPYLRSFLLNDSLAVMIGWPVAGVSYPMTLDSLRRDCRQFNVLHKYHQKEDDIDNDFFLVLGQVDRNSVSDENMEDVQRMLRQSLAEREPVELFVRPEDLAVVAYSDAQLPTADSVMYSLVEARASIEVLKLYYPEISQ